MSKLFNRAGHTCATAGTGTVTLGAALGAVATNTCSYQTFATSGVADTNVVTYLILDSNGAWEYGTGTYTSAGTTLSRTLGQSSTGSLLSLSGSSQVFITARKEDIANLGEANTFTAANTLAAGTTALAPLTFQSGTSLTTPTAGVLEYDGTVHYSTHAASERGIIPSLQWIRLAATYTLISQTAAQKLFNASANGSVTVAGSTLYEFESYFNLSALSAVAGTYGFAIGGTATLTSVLWNSLNNKTLVMGTGGLSSGAATATFSLTNATASNIVITPSNTTTTGQAWIQGIIAVNAGGTIIPQVSLGQAAAAVVGINSFFKIWPIGINTQTTQGNWS